RVLGPASAVTKFRSPLACPPARTVNSAACVDLLGHVGSAIIILPAVAFPAIEFIGRIQDQLGERERCKYPDPIVMPRFSAQVWETMSDEKLINRLRYVFSDPTVVKAFGKLMECVHKTSDSINPDNWDSGNRCQDTSIVLAWVLSEMGLSASVVETTSLRSISVGNLPVKCMDHTWVVISRNGCGAADSESIMVDLTAYQYKARSGDSVETPYGVIGRRSDVMKWAGDSASFWNTGTIVSHPNVIGYLRDALESGVPAGDLPNFRSKYGVHTFPESLRIIEAVRNLLIQAGPILNRDVTA
ncbi:hypothetical protein EBR96_05770, partial [bacterium]|nr:hypothetical protein [bacterium]